MSTPQVQYGYANQTSPPGRGRRPRRRVRAPSQPTDDTGDIYPDFDRLEKFMEFGPMV